MTHVQIKKLQLMLGEVLESNEFYRRKFKEVGLDNPSDIRTLEDTGIFKHLPFTTKQEVSEDQAANPPYGTNLTYPRERYTRIHQTSGTTGAPLRWLDTPESWDWWGRCWATVYTAAGIGSGERIFFAFSFGLFIGFWSAHQGAQRVGALTIPGGGMSSYQRTKAILDHEVTVLVCTPTYSLHLAEVAEQEGFDIVNSAVKTVILAGEPGASLPATKRRIEKAWGAKCYDHAGATEVGAWGYECRAQSGLHINEGEFIAEIIDPSSGEHAEQGELVMTNLGRTGMPLIRYRTGDRVLLNKTPCECGRTYIRLDGGVIGRVDDVLVVRGINVFPSAIENIVRMFTEVGEFVVDVFRKGDLDEMAVRIEVREDDPETVVAAVAKEIRNALGLRVLVSHAPFGTLPRFDLKARRFTDHRK